MKILTLNLRHNQDRWEERFPLVVEVLEKHQPDIIGFQEVWRPIQQADRILDQVAADGWNLKVLAKQGKYGREGIAIASRYPISSHESIDLPGNERVAQRALLEVNGTQLWIANTHLHHQPKDESVRLPQMQALLRWLADTDPPTILTGDMNATPESVTIREAKQIYSSAHEAVHGTEPAVTSPTPLAPDYRSGQGSTIDYIFYSGDKVRVTAASVVANEPHPEDETLYPSDHFGILASIELEGIVR